MIIIKMMYLSSQEKEANILIIIHSGEQVLVRNMKVSLSNPEHNDNLGDFAVKQWRQINACKAC